jgi:hypothetical protein
LNDGSRSPKGFSLKAPGRFASFFDIVALDERDSFFQGSSVQGSVPGEDVFCGLQVLFIFLFVRKASTGEEWPLPSLRQVAKESGARGFEAV